MSSTRIRLQRFGQRHSPVYRIVACSRYAARDKKFLEILGSYNPIPDRHGNKQVTVNTERLKKWIRHGAEPSERVSKLLGVAEILPPFPRRALLRREDADSADSAGSGGGASGDAEEPATESGAEETDASDAEADASNAGGEACDAAAEGTPVPAATAEATDTAGAAGAAGAPA